MAQHFDPEEIDKFEALAEEWWDENGRFKPLHMINPLRLDYIAARINLSDATILDIGCGGGLLAEGMARRGAAVTGIDRAEKPLTVASLHAEQQGLRVDYQNSDAETWGGDHASVYDAVTCLEVLEHVPDVPSTVKAAADMLKPGGLFFFATLNRTLKSYLFAILGAEYVCGWLPRGTHQHDKFIRPSELVEAMRAAGLNVAGLQGMSFDALARRFSISDDLSVNYLGFAKKPLR
ncbi:MAG: bifunctional 2-polyprenyl-6-hydroxyphenol methylase/3-demethylubiquinol 3-O-methyltransferase UbiG [Mariprofundaceae bacterium]